MEIFTPTIMFLKPSWSQSKSWCLKTTVGEVGQDLNLTMLHDTPTNLTLPLCPFLRYALPISSNIMPSIYASTLFATTSYNIGISPTRILQDSDSENYMAMSDSILPLLTISATRNDFRRDFTQLTGTFLPYTDNYYSLS